HVGRALAVAHARPEAPEPGGLAAREGRLTGRDLGGLVDLLGEPLRHAPRPAGAAREADADAGDQREAPHSLRRVLGRSGSYARSCCSPRTGTDPARERLA